MASGDIPECSRVTVRGGEAVLVIGRAIDLTEGADSDRPELDEAREYLNEQKSGEAANRVVDE
jgi:hypothetical protein